MERWPLSSDARWPRPQDRHWRDGHGLPRARREARSPGRHAGSLRTAGRLLEAARHSSAWPCAGLTGRRRMCRKPCHPGSAGHDTVSPRGTHHSNSLSHDPGSRGDRWVLGDQRHGATPRASSDRRRTNCNTAAATECVNRRRGRQHRGRHDRARDMRPDGRRVSRRVAT